MHSLASARVPRGQLSLFECPTVQDVRQQRGVHAYRVRQLWFEGLLSFEPEDSLRLQPARVAELDFLCGLVGLIAPRDLSKILGSLEAPYAYRLERLCFDFCSGGWMLRHEEREEVSEALEVCCL